MRFNIFTFQEYIFKWLSYSIVLIFTIGSIVLLIFHQNINSYINTEFADIALLNTDLLIFLISIGYALLLFLVNIYMTNISTTTQNLFYRRKEQYVNIKELASVFKIKDSDDESLFSFIFMIRGLTGRTGEREVNALIKLDGFQFTNKYNKLEDSFIEMQSELRSVWNERVKSYIQSRNLRTNSRNVHIFDLADFLSDIDYWINQNLELTTDQLRLFTYFVTSTKNETQEKYKKYVKTKRQLTRAIAKINKKANSQVQRLEIIYGERLRDSINSDYNLVSNLQVLERLIRDLEGKIITYEDYQELTNENFRVIEEQLREVDFKLRITAENIEELLSYNRDF